MMKKRLVPKWVHLCFTNDGAVFLDLRRDQYFGLDGSSAKVLRSLVDGDDSAACATLASELVARGLLTEDPRTARPLTPTHLVIPDCAFADSESDERPKVKIGQALMLIRIAVTVWAALRGRSIEYAVERFRRIKARRGAESTLNPRRTDELIAVFLHLRPLLFVSRERCLMNALILAEFLQRNGVTATCVFGVTTLPFAAHSWVQTEHTIATEENRQFLLTFSPICAI
jgi:hypothetical protein